MKQSCGGSAGSMGQDTMHVGLPVMLTLVEGARFGSGNKGDIWFSGIKPSDVGFS